MNKVIVIAEAGVNHDGDINKAFQLIDIAKHAGADYVKFQTFKTELAISKNAKKADYQVINTDNAHESQYEMVKQLELSHDDHHKLIDYCNQKNIKFLSTAFDLESVDFLKDKIDFYKIPSGEITNLPYLRKVAQLGLPIVMSSGMATLLEIKEAIAVLTSNGIAKNTITVLHCNTEYPTPYIDVNLLAMQQIKDELNVAIGYSDHTLGIEVAIAAVALGATVIEKHFTIDRRLPGPDHKASLEPSELKQMVQSIRNIEMALGDGIKQPSQSELKNITIARKSIVALKPIKKDEVFTVGNITVKRPGSGISPMFWDEVINKVAKKDFEEDELIEI